MITDLRMLEMQESPTAFVSAIECQVDGRYHAFPFVVEKTETVLRMLSTDCEDWAMAFRRDQLIRYLMVQIDAATDAIAVAVGERKLLPA